MYQIESARGALRGHASKDGRGRRLQWPRVSRNVLLLGITSLLTDLSAEMVTTILPLYLVYTLGLTPLQFGVVDGLHQGAAALVRVLGGVTADRSRRYKEVAALGYGLSAVSKLAFLAVGGAWTAVSAIILLDRTGKGIRTAPRDALISLSSGRADLGTAFGVHRALDTAGAMLGPLVAFGLLAMAPRAFDAVFVVSFCFALLGLAVLVLFVQNRPAQGEERSATLRGRSSTGDDGSAAGEDVASADGRRESDRRVSLRAAVGLLGLRPFRTLVFTATALSLATISDAFLYLGLQRRLGFDAHLLPLLYVGTALAYMALAVPVGRLADRVGHRRVFLGGYAALLLVYTSLLLPALGLPVLFVYLVLFGAYYAATDGLLMALGSRVLPPELRGTGLGLLTTATSLSRLFAAVLFGAIWTWAGVQAAVVAFAVGLVLAMALAVASLARVKEQGALRA